MTFELIAVSDKRSLAELANPAAALSPIERARQVLRFDETKTQLTELLKNSERIVEITNKAGRDEAHAAEMALKSTRTGIRKTGKDARDDAVKFGKSVIAVEDELIAITQGEEDRLNALKAAWDDARAAEKAKAEQDERERVAKQTQLLDELRSIPVALVGASSTKVRAALDDVLVEAFGRDDGLDDAARIKADAIRGVVIKTLEGMLTAAQAQETQAAELAAQKKALDARQKALDAEKLAADQREAAIKAEAEALEKKQKADAHREEQDALAKQKQADDAAAVATLPPHPAVTMPATQDVTVAPVNLPLFADKVDVVSLLVAARQALSLLISLGRGQHPIAQKLRAAIAVEEAL